MAKTGSALRKKVLEEFVRVGKVPAPEPTPPEPEPVELPEPKVVEFRPWANSLERREKSLAMLALEATFGKPMEELLALPTKGVVLAAHLGVSQATITRWRERLGIVQPYSPEGHRRSES